MREFIHHGDLRAPAEDRVRIHFFEPASAVLDRLSGNGFQAFAQRDRLPPSVRLEVADDDVNAALFELVGFRQHLVGLADTRRIAQKDFEPTARRRWVRHCGKTRTSMPSASRIRRSSGVPPSRFRQPRRRL